MVVFNNRWAPRTATKDKIPRLRAYVAKVTREKGEQAGAQAIRELCKRDLYYLSYEILNYRDLVEPLHDDLCDFLEDCDRRQLTNVVLIPRGHFKSTIATVARCIQWMIRDRNTAIGLGSADLKSAKKFLREIRQQLEQNNKLKKLFPEVFWADPTRQAPKWTEEEIQIKRDKVKKEGTVKVFGLEDGLPTGDHYDHMVIDDAVNEDNVRTEERLAKVSEQSKYLRPLLTTPDQPINWVGTRYHLLDIYQKLVDNPKTAVYLRKAIEDGAPIFKERFSQETLNDTRDELGSYVFSCQYMLEPIDPADKKFRTEWLKRYGREIHKKYGFVFFLMVDPASRNRKKSDFTAMIVLAVDQNWNFYLVDGVHDKLNPAQRVDAVFNLVKKWGIEIVGYETIGFQETDKFYIERRQAEENLYFRVEEVSKHKTRKEERIEGLQPLMERGKFHVPNRPITYVRQWENPDDGQGKTVDIVEELIREMEHYPHATHDDILDATTMGREIAYAGYQLASTNGAEKSADYNAAGIYAQAEEEGSPLI